MPDRQSSVVASRRIWPAPALLRTRSTVKILTDMGLSIEQARQAILDALTEVCGPPADTDKEPIEQQPTFRAWNPDETF